MQKWTTLDWTLCKMEKFRGIEEVQVKNGPWKTTEGYLGVYKAPGEDRLTCNITNEITILT